MAIDPRMYHNAGVQADDMAERIIHSDDAPLPLGAALIVLAIVLAVGMLIGAIAYRVIT